MSHVAPTRFADAFAGRLSPAERAADEAHVRGCSRCAAEQARVVRASDSFATIRALPAPEVPWDAVRARVHWEVSKEKRLGTGELVARRRWPWTIAGLAVAAGVTALVVTRADAPAPAPIAHAPAASRIAPAPEARARPAPLVGLVSRSAGEIRVDGAPVADLYARVLAAGSVVATGEGRLDVQFGDGSALALGPRSTVELRRFDAEAVELVVRGTLDVEVAPRAPGQRFVVIAGDREVVVRGTQFRVEHGAEGTAVACRHGLVVVRDPQAEVEVGAARRIALPAAAPLSPARVEPLTVDELDALAAATPLRGPLWDPTALLASSAPLSVEGGARAVRLDGVEIGLAPLVVRVMPGRHTVEAADSAGRFRRAGWVDVAAPSTGAATRPARHVLPAEPRTDERTASSDQRRRQLRDGIDRTRLARCVRSIARSGLTGTYVQIEIAVDGSGAVDYLNVIDTDLPAATTRCVQTVLDGVRFGGGASASWRERIDL